MGTVLEMRTQLLSVLCAITLGACGNAPDIQTARAGTQSLIALFRGKTTESPIGANPNDPAIKAGILALRAGMQKDGQPVILASNKSLKFGTFLAPFGGSNGVITWSSTGYQMISLKDGVMVATRGFGPDLMSSVLPTIGTIAAAQGTTQRRYSYLDGGDQPQSQDYTCILAPGGSESIEVVGLTFVTRKVTEACSGDAGTFTNEYWFDGGTKLRQSKQFLALGLDNMSIQRVID